MNKSKAETFVGFAVRAGRLRSGANTLSTLKKAYLILVCKTAAENTVKTAVKYAGKYRCNAFITVEKELSEIVHKDGVKIAAITDRALAKAIQDTAAEVFTELCRSAADNKRNKNSDENKTEKND
ncbi:MAG: hypothetical protein IJU83_00185 [Clostridia bacterium]|nr:hypothetical protein [Clostridia bacterium]